MDAPVKLSATGVLAVLGIAVAGYAAWRLYGVAKGVGKAASDAVKTTLNPASDQNFVNQTVLKVGQAVTGDSSWSLGGWLFDVTHPHAFDNPATPIKQTIDMGHGDGWDAPDPDAAAARAETARLLARYPGTSGPDVILGGSGYLALA